MLGDPDPDFEPNGPVVPCEPLEHLFLGENPRAVAELSVCGNNISREEGVGFKFCRENTFLSKPGEWQYHGPALTLWFGR